MTPPAAPPVEPGTTLGAECTAGVSGVQPEAPSALQSIREKSRGKEEHAKAMEDHHKGPDGAGRIKAGGEAVAASNSATGVRGRRPRLSSRLSGSVSTRRVPSNMWS